MQQIVDFYREAPITRNILCILAKEAFIEVGLAEMIENAKCVDRNKHINQDDNKQCGTYQL